MVSKSLDKNGGLRFGRTHLSGNHHRVEETSNAQSIEQTKKTRVEVRDDPEQVAAGLEGSQYLQGLGIQPPGVSASEAGEERIEVIGKLGERSQRRENVSDQIAPPLFLQHEDLLR